MWNNLESLPFPFWAVMLLLMLGAAWAFCLRNRGLGLPVLAVLATVAAWYVFDAFYNDYRDYYQKFDPTVLESAWWQVALFLLSFLMLSQIAHLCLNRRCANKTGVFVRFLREGCEQPVLQAQLRRFLIGCIAVWAVLATVAVIRLQSESFYYFFPYLGCKAEAWGRGRIGSGFDSLLSLANYLQLFVASGFGVAAALARNGSIRLLAVAGCFLTWPYYFFDRTRNPMLSVAVPFIISWVFIRLRVGILQKVIVLAGFFLVINGWFKFVMENRSEMQIAVAFREKGFQTESEVHHLGLNMFEELCWINSFLANGTYSPNRGERYFAELVNPIPRSLWPGKPLIGIDYAILRGQAGGNDIGAGVFATISTGMIGQGVVNFGTVFGPMAAALLMAIWVSVLARLDLEGDRMGRLPVYALGMILTFNLGRDITLITLYSFIFGIIVIRWLDRRKLRRASTSDALEPQSCGPSHHCLPVARDRRGLS